MPKSSMEPEGLLEKTCGTQEVLFRFDVIFSWEQRNFLSALINKPPPVINQRVPFWWESRGPPDE